MQNYFHIPAIRFLKPAFIAALAISSMASLLYIIGLGLSVIALSSQEHIANTGGNAPADWGSALMVVASLFGGILLVVATFFTLAVDLEQNFAFQKDGRDSNPNGSRKMLTRPPIQCALALSVLLPFSVMATESNNLDFMSFVFFYGTIAAFVTIPAVALVRTLLHRAELRRVGAV